MRTGRSTTSLTKISERLFLGNSDDVESLSSANPHCIEAVITLCEEPIQRRVNAIHYLHLPIRDARPVTISWLGSILTTIEDHYKDGPVLVHRSAGISRSPIVVAAFLDRVGLLNFRAALCFIENIRPAIAPSRVLVESIAADLTNNN